MTDTHNQARGQVIWCSSACTKNSSKSTLLPLLRGGLSQKVKVLVLVDRWEMSITIAEVQYLYPRLDYESWSNKTDHKTWKRKQNNPNFKITWTSTFPFHEVWRVFFLQSLSIGPILSRWWRHLMDNPVSQFGWIFWLTSGFCYPKPNFGVKKS